MYLTSLFHTDTGQVGRGPTSLIQQKHIANLRNLSNLYFYLSPPAGKEDILHPLFNFYFLIPSF